MIKTAQIQHGLMFFIRDNHKASLPNTLVIFCFVDSDDVFPNAAENLEKACNHFNIREKPERWEQTYEQGFAADILCVDQHIQDVDLSQSRLTTYTLRGLRAIGIGKTAIQRDLAAKLALSLYLINAFNEGKSVILPEALRNYESTLKNPNYQLISGTFNWYPQVRSPVRSPDRKTKKAKTGADTFTVSTAQQLKQSGIPSVSYQEVLDFLEKSSRHHRATMQRELPTMHLCSSDITANDFAWQSFIAHIRNIDFIKAVVGPGISRFAVCTQCIQSSEPRICDTYFVVTYIDSMESKLSLKNEQGELIAHLQSLTHSNYSNTCVLPQRNDVMGTVIRFCEQFMTEHFPKKRDMHAQDLAADFVRSVGSLTLQLNVESLADSKSIKLCRKYENRLLDFLHAQALKHKQ